MDGAPQRVAIVTGASRGIGRAIAHRLSGAGYRLVLAARSADALGEVALSLATPAVSCALTCAEPMQQRRWSRWRSNASVASMRW